MANYKKIAPNCEVDLDQMMDISKSDFKAMFLGKLDADKAWKVLEIYRKTEKKKSSK